MRREENTLLRQGGEAESAFNRKGGETQTKGEYYKEKLIQHAGVKEKFFIEPWGDKRFRSATRQNQSVRSH